MSDETIVIPDDLMIDPSVSHEGIAGALQQAAEWLVHFVHTLGYPGIFIMSFLESTFVPIPSEVTMIPAGYLAQQGQMNLFAVLFLSITGTIGGALFNYYIAVHYGRKFIYAYGKYFFFGHDKMAKLEKFFKMHGDISTFTGRLIPGLRHFISFPAGLAHMNLKKFCIYTGAGGAIWMTTLVMVGYIIGGNKALIKLYMPYITGACLATVVIMIVLYVWNHRRKSRRH